MNKKLSSLLILLLLLSSQLVLIFLHVTSQSKPEWSYFLIAVVTSSIGVFIGLKTRIKTHPRNLIIRPPGAIWAIFTELVVSSSKFDRVIEPIFADWQKEYFDALQNNRGAFKLLMIRVRYTHALLKAIGLLGFLQVLNKVIKGILSGS